MYLVLERKKVKYWQGIPFFMFLAVYIVVAFLPMFFYTPSPDDSRCGTPGMIGLLGMLVFGGVVTIGTHILFFLIRWIIKLIH